MDLDKSRIQLDNNSEISMEDFFIKGFIPPNVETEFISIKTFLVAKCIYDGCTCCRVPRYAKIPVTVLPFANP
jgi:hypothetical protein